MYEEENQSESSDMDIEELACYHQEIQDAAQAQEFPDRLFDPFNAIVFRHYLKNNSDFVNFSKVSRHVYAKTAGAREIRAASALLLPVVQGNEGKTKRLLEFNPGLLCSAKGVATDNSDRPIQDLTSFQAALCAGDVDMCEMMKKEGFAKLENAQAELDAQFNEVFPEGFEAHIEVQKKNIFGFDDVLQAIIQAPAEEVAAALDRKFNNDLPLHRALDTFRKNFTEKSKSERVFNPYHLLRAFAIHDSLLGNLANSGKDILFWCQVIGYMERYLPACYGQAFAQGLGHIIMKDEPLHRSFQFRDDDEALFPLMDGARLGYHFAIGYQPRATVGSVGDGRDAKYFFEIISSKNSRLGKITQHCVDAHIERDLSLCSR